MEKHALFEVGTTNVRLTLAKVVEGENFFIYKTMGEHVRINEHIETDGLIKSAKIFECVAILQMYKKICEAEGVRNFTAVAADNLTSAKNYKSFLDEAGAAIGVEFKVLTPEDETNLIYTAVINTLDVPKGVIVNVSSYATRIIHYNRRMILDNVTIPFGSATLLDKAEKQPIIAVDIFKKELAKNAPFLQDLDPETTIVGVSEVFVSFGRLARKMKKYPLETDHNFAADAETFGQVFDFIKSLDMEKKQKLKGISSHSAATISSGMCIVDAVFKHSGLKNLVVACGYRNIGILLRHSVPYTTERPITDILGWSLDVICGSASLHKKRAAQLYNLALLIFKQLKVIHKLPRMYAKVLRIACYLYDYGKKMNAENFERNNYHAILASPVLGATHKEVILAAFAASFKKVEDLNLQEWIRYKDICSDEDLDAVRKLGIIIAMAEALNIREQDIIKDINCDILGDSVILKLVTELDQRASKVDVKAAEVEIFHAKKYTGEFFKAFKKSLELL